MKKTKTVEYYVRVDPERLGNFGSVSMSDRLIEPDEDRRMDRYRKRCEEISQDIKRHVDNVSFVSVESEEEHVCEFCGSIWSEISDRYNGGCCDEDMKHMEELDAKD